MTQWLLEMKTLAQKYERINNRITRAWEKGYDDFRKVWGEGELPALLEKLRKMPVPIELEWKWYKENFEAGISAQIKGLTIAAKDAGRSVPGSNWGAEMHYWMLVSKGFLDKDNMMTDLSSFRKKYQI